MADWSLVDVAGKPAVVLEPPGGRFGLLWLHARIADRPAQLTELLHRHRLNCIIPYALDTWWVDRVWPRFDPVLSAEQHVSKNVVPWMESRWKLGSKGIAAAGIEMGGQGAIRLAFRSPKRFPVVAGLGSALDFHELHGLGTSLDMLYESRERARQDTAILHLNPADWPPHLWFGCDPADPWFRGNDRLLEKLRAYGVPHTADLNATGNDSSSFLEDEAAPLPALEPMIAFLADRLERESRRLM